MKTTLSANWVQLTLASLLATTAMHAGHVLGHSLPTTIYPAVVSSDAKNIDFDDMAPLFESS
jgi:hypothetical protein